MDSIFVRLANQDDSLDVLSWRNDSNTIRMSHCADAVSAEDHTRWFATALESRKRVLLICCDSANGAKVGMVRFDLECCDTAVISINIAPSMRGAGFAKPCLKQALRSFAAANPDVKLVMAQIKVENFASRQSFVGVGFRLVGKVEGVQHYEFKIEGQLNPHRECALG